MFGNKDALAEPGYTTGHEPERTLPGGIASSSAAADRSRTRYPPYAFQSWQHETVLQPQTLPVPGLPGVASGSLNDQAKSGVSYPTTKVCSRFCPTPTRLSFVPINSHTFSR
jgi:hypothetical protein